MAIIGYVNTEEILVRKLAIEEDVRVDGYLLFKNDAFASHCNKWVIIDKEYIASRFPFVIRGGSYGVVYLGPILASIWTSGVLRENKINHIGSTLRQLEFELDKTAITEVFPPITEILPLTIVFTEFDERRIRRCLEGLKGEYVLKFVGDYTKRYRGSEVGRVRLSGETLAGLHKVLKML